MTHFKRVLLLVALVVLAETAMVMLNARPRVPLEFWLWFWVVGVFAPIISLGLFGRLISRKATTQPEKTSQAEELKPVTRSERIWSRLQGQGHERHLALRCLHPMHLPLPDELDDSSDASLSASILRYLECQYEQIREDAKGTVVATTANDWIALAASGLLIYGRLDMMEVILDNLSRESYFTDHGAGQCILLPYLAISRALPIPRGICSCTLAQGHVTIQAAREWFHTNQHRLIWSEEQRRFVFAESP